MVSPIQNGIRMQVLSPFNNEAPGKDLKMSQSNRWMGSEGIGATTEGNMATLPTVAMSTITQEAANAQQQH